MTLRDVRHFRQKRRNATRCCDALDPIGGSWRKQNDAISIPGPAPTVSRVTNRLWWRAAYRHFLQLSLSKESDSCTVRRPEWVRCAVSPSEWPRGGGIQRSQPY